MSRAFSSGNARPASGLWQRHGQQGGLLILICLYDSAVYAISTEFLSSSADHHMLLMCEELQRPFKSVYEYIDTLIQWE